MEDLLAIVNQELHDLVGTARGQVREEGGATGGGESASRHHVGVGVRGHLMWMKNKINLGGRGGGGEKDIYRNFQL